jgi:hypothetical protein
MQQFSPAVTLAHPFCTLAQASLLLGLTYKGAHSRYSTGRLDHLLVRLPNGEEWRPGGFVWLSALKLRDLLDADGLRLFEQWQRGETKLRGSSTTSGHDL